jgi:hypothetical protein
MITGVDTSTAKELCIQLIQEYGNTKQWRLRHTLDSIGLKTSTVSIVVYVEDRRIPVVLNLVLGVCRIAIQS